MRNHASLAALALVLSAAPGAAQLSFFHGPELAPVGCPVHLTLSNDGPSTVFHDPCGFEVFDASGSSVFKPACSGVVQLDPGDVFTQTWNQVDQLGQQVPAGTYHLGNPAGLPVVVGGAAAAIAPLGAPKIGTARPYQLCAPLDAGFPYLLGAAGSNAFGIATCAGVVPLDPDPILALSLSSASFLPGFVGALDGSGLSAAPTLVLPADAKLVGLDLILAFVVLDPSQSCPVRRISAPLGLKLF